MRTVEEIKTDVNDCRNCKTDHDCMSMLTNCEKRWNVEHYENELLRALTANITLERVEELIKAEQDGRLIVRPNCNTCVHKFVWYGHEPCCKCYGNDSIAEKGNYHLTTAAAEAALKEGKPCR